MNRPTPSARVATADVIAPAVGACAAYGAGVEPATGALLDPAWREPWSRPVRVPVQLLPNKQRNAHRQHHACANAKAGLPPVGHLRPEFRQMRVRWNR